VLVLAQTQTAIEQQKDAIKTKNRGLILLAIGLGVLSVLLILGKITPP